MFIKSGKSTCSFGKSLKEKSPVFRLFCRVASALPWSGQSVVAGRHGGPEEGVPEPGHLLPRCASPQTGYRSVTVAIESRFRRMQCNKSFGRI